MSHCKTSEDTFRSIDGDVYRYERAADELPSEAVVVAVSEVADRPITPYGLDDDERVSEPLTPLYEEIDPDALDALVAGPNAGADRSVTFTYGGHTVTVCEAYVTVSLDA